MPEPRLTSLARLAAVAIVAVTLGACASTYRARDTERAPNTAVVVRSSGWLNGTFESPDAPDPSAVTRPPAPNRSLQADSPWLGILGLRRVLPGDAEIGFGVALPNPYQPQAIPTPLPADRFRDVGVGVWLTFDF